MKRITISGLMAVVVVCGALIAAMRDPNVHWSGWISLLVINALASSVLVSIYRRGKKRAAAIGFTVFAGTYFVTTLVPDLVNRLPTTQLISQVNLYLNAPPPTPATALVKSQIEQATAKRQALLDAGTVNSPGAGLGNFGNYDALQAVEAELAFSKSLLGLTLPIDSLDARQFSILRHQIGQGLFTFIAGLIGSIVAVWLYRTQESRDPAAGGTSSLPTNPSSEA